MWQLTATRICGRLFGKYLELGRDEEQVQAFLKECGVNPGNCKQATQALAQRMLKIGFIVKAPLPPEISKTSRATDTDIAAFVNKKLPQDLEACFLGIGEKTGEKYAGCVPPSSRQLGSSFLTALCHYSLGQAQRCRYLVN